MRTLTSEEQAIYAALAQYVENENCRDDVEDVRAANPLLAFAESVLERFDATLAALAEPPRFPNGPDVIVDAYLRAKAEQIGQTQLAKFIGTKRQGVNAIINNKPGCRFTLDHLDRFVANTGARTSRVFMELARLASELDATPLTIKMTVSAEKVTHPAKE